MASGMAGPFRFDPVFWANEHQTISFRSKINTLPRAPWTASTPYVVGDFVTNPSDATAIFMAVVAGTSQSSAPTWPAIAGARVAEASGPTWMRVASTRLLDTTGYTAEWEVRDVPNGTLLASGSTGNGRAEVGFSPAKWAIGTAYALGQQVVPTTPNGYVYQAEQAGTSHATTEPVWVVPTVAGIYGALAPTDGTVKWRLISDDSGVSNRRIQLTPAYTNGLTLFAGCVFQFDLVDAFGKRQPINWGYASLSGRVT